MRLDTEIVIYELIGHSSYIGQIKIFLNQDKILRVSDVIKINPTKLKTTPDRITRILRRVSDKIRLSDSNFIQWTTWDIRERSMSVKLSSDDILSLNLDKGLKNTVRSILNGTLIKSYVKNPSKEKSQMEYRKRAYYGNCKRK